MFLASSKKQTEGYYSITIGGNSKFFIFIPKIGEDFQFDEHIFLDWLKPPTRLHVLLWYIIEQASSFLH